MYLEPNRDDRDYLYGRLLALADNFEESVLRKQGVKDRPTNAIKFTENGTWDICFMDSRIRMRILTII